MLTFTMPNLSQYQISSVFSDKEDSSAESNSASEALLSEDSTIENRYQPNRRCSSNRYFFFHFFIFILYITVGSFIIPLLNPNQPCELLYSPAEEAIAKPQVVTFDNPHNATTAWRGQPREELHAAWRSLLQYHNIRVSGSVLRKINRTSVPLNDEAGGYLVTLDVFHQIHCLNQIRQQIYHEYYYPDTWNSTDRFMHADHCLDLMRQVLMCRGDVSLLTYRWIDGFRKPWPDYGVSHTCHNWDNIMHWASENYIPSGLKGDILRHPELGPSYPEGGDDEDH